MVPHREQNDTGAVRRDRAPKKRIDQFRGLLDRAIRPGPAPDKGSSAIHPGPNAILSPSGILWALLGGLAGEVGTGAMKCAGPPTS
jgi:hypothetical protein